MDHMATLDGSVRRTVAVWAVTSRLGAEDTARDKARPVVIFSHNPLYDTTRLGTFGYATGAKSMKCSSLIRNSQYPWSRHQVL